MSLDRFRMNEEQKKAQTQAMNKKDFDSRFWKPAIKTPNSTANSPLPSEYIALVRTLPRGMDFTKPFAVMTKDHYFKANGQFFSALCRKTYGDKEFCPVCDMAWKIYNLGKANGDESLKKMGKERLPTTHYICNVLVLKDKVKSENDGHVKLWKMTEPMYKFIEGAIIPKPVTTVEEDDLSGSSAKKLDPFIPHDPVEGRNLIMKLVPHPKTKFPSYESSEWYKPELGLLPVAATEAEIERILLECNDLTEFTASVKSVEQLAADILAFESKSAPVAAGSAPGVITTPSFDMPSNVKAPAIGNSAEYFATLPTPPTAAAVTAPVQPTVSVPVVAPVVPQGDPTEDDELPF